MAGLSGKITKFLATPQGRRLTDQAVRRAARLAQDPKTRAQLQRVVARFGQRRP